MQRQHLQTKKNNCISVELQWYFLGETQTLWICTKILISGWVRRDLPPFAEGLDEQQEGVVNHCLSPYNRQPDPPLH